MGEGYVAPPAGITVNVPTNVRIEDSAGIVELQVTAAGVAATTGLITVQGSPTGSPIPVSTAAGSSVQVEGRAASGAALVGNPVRIGISDGANAQDIRQGAPSASAFPPAGSVQIAMAAIAADGTNLRPIAVASGLGDAQLLTNGLPAGIWIYNGATFDRARAGNPTASSQGATGVLSAGIAGADGTVYRGISVASALPDATTLQTSLGVGLWAFNGASFDRLRTATADELASTGLLAAGTMIFDGGAWDRARADAPNSGALMIGGQGTAGTPAGGVVTVQGATGMTAIQVTQASPVAANVLSGSVQNVATGTTIITIPQARTWIGTLAVTLAAQNPTQAAQASAAASIVTAGATVTPAAGTVLCRAAIHLAATNAVGNTSPNQGAESTTVQNVVVIAPAGNAVTLNTLLATGGAFNTSDIAYIAVGALQ